MENPSDRGHRDEANRRKYVRMDSVFPVQLCCLDQGGRPRDSWIQCFTSNVSSGGILVEVSDAHHAFAQSLAAGCPVALKIQIPAGAPAQATARVEWITGIESSGRCLIGLSYETMDNRSRGRIMAYVRARQFFFHFVMAVIFMLCMAIAAVGYRSVLLMKGNKILIAELIRILQDSSVAKQTIKDISREKEALQLKIDALKSRITALGEEHSRTREAEAESNQKLSQMSLAVEKLEREKALLQDELIALQHRENSVSEKLLMLGEKKSMLQKANIDAMYRWLSARQSARTGLLASFEGDDALARVAFSSDQGLAMQAFCVFSDFERAKKISEFFNKKAKRKDRLFYTSYYADDGAPADLNVRAEPNLWVGISLLQYAGASADKSGVKTAEEIAAGLLPQAGAGQEAGTGILEYAFFSMLAAETGNPEYSAAARTLLDRMAVAAPDGGKAYPAIDADAYAECIASLGPERLADIGMNPETIMESADEKGFVEVDFERPDGTTVKVAGYDFSSAAGADSGPAVSSERTAQMVVSLRIMADYYRGLSLEAKARTYEDKAEERLLSLCAMIISSPSASGQGESCVPYASREYVDTGHGWKSPRGKATGSVAGTCYTIFAFYRHNPLHPVRSTFRPVGSRQTAER